MAGGGRAVDQQAISDGLTHRLSFCAELALSVTDDGVIALEAGLGSRSGMVVLVGSGSLILGRLKSGKTIRSGGGAIFWAMREVVMR